MEADVVSATGTFITFYTQAATGPQTAGSFNVAEIFGFYQSDKANVLLGALQNVRGINQ